MRVIELTINPKTNEVFGIEKLPEFVQSKISSHFLNGMRNKKQTRRERVEIARIAGRKSGEVRRRKAIENRKVKLDLNN